MLYYFHREPSRSHSDAHYMEEHLFGCPNMDANKPAFNAKKPKGFFRTSDVVHLDSHLARSCLNRSQGSQAKKLNVNCKQHLVSEDVAVFHHYRYGLCMVQKV